MLETVLINSLGTIQHFSTQNLNFWENWTFVQNSSVINAVDIQWHAFQRVPLKSLQALTLARTPTPWPELYQTAPDGWFVAVLHLSLQSVDEKLHHVCLVDGEFHRC